MNKPVEAGSDSPGCESKLWLLLVGRRITLSLSFSVCKMEIIILLLTSFYLQ